MPLLELADTFLHYETIGTGRPALVLHGGLGLDQSHMRSLDVLADIYSLTYYDHSGNGRSGRPPLESITFATLAADADRLREALGHDKITLIGSSFGGGVALQYALQYPDRVEGLILMGAVAHNESGESMIADFIARGVNPAAFAALSDPSCTDEQIRETYRALFPAYFHDASQAFTDRLVDATLFSARALQRSFEMVADYDLREAVTAIMAPALIVTGKSDLSGIYRGSCWLGMALPNATAVEVEAAGHLVFIENRQRLRRHRFDTAKTLTALRVRMTATHGSDTARLYEIRCYAS